MIFFTVLAEFVLADSNKCTRPALQRVYWRPKLFNWHRWLVWKFNVVGFGQRVVTEALNNLSSNCSGHVVMLQEMGVEINNACSVILAYQHAIFFQEAENIVAIVKRYLRTSFATVLAALLLFVVTALLQSCRAVLPGLIHREL